MNIIKKVLGKLFNTDNIPHRRTPVFMYRDEFEDEEFAKELLLGSFHEDCGDR